MTHAATDNSEPRDQLSRAPVDQVLRQHGVDPAAGLTSAEAAKRLARFGRNQLREIGDRPVWRILLDQFKGLVMLFLGAAAVLSFALGDWKEGIAILVVILLNATIGFLTEWRATRSMEALRRLGATMANVRRDGRVVSLPAAEIVPGDIAILEGGDVATADMRLIEASRIEADESALTGESAPVRKHAGPEASVEEITRGNMLYKGTALTLGSGEAVVVATGMATELGRISALTERAESATTPLEKRLDRMAAGLIWLTLGLTVIVVALGVLAGRDPFVMVKTAVALMVAMIPEGLPVVATIALARGLWRLSRRQALVNRLAAVETLGATTVICTDKTGTLTENRMSVVKLLNAAGTVDLSATDDGFVFTRSDPIDPLQHDALRSLLEVGVLCTNASLSVDPDTQETMPVGDPLESALLVVAAQAGLDAEHLGKIHPEIGEEAFDPDLKMMATVHESDGAYRIAVKGAPEAILDACTSVLEDDEVRPLTEQGRQAWRDRCDAVAADGYRLLAAAHRFAPSPDGPAFQDLVFLGVFVLLDPARTDVRPVMDACRKAGIRVVMLTGDHPSTAACIGQAVGLTTEAEPTQLIVGSQLPAGASWTASDRERIRNATIIARVSPAQKLDLIQAWQESGAVVGMLGDGVNDAPALKQADIGVAMGKRGTQVAREAADMVLKDDAFASVLAAVRQGRIIFDNIRKFVVYLISCNLSEVLVVGLASLAQAPLPILPLQILFLNLVTDVFPALALGVGEGDPRVMERAPRDPKEGILTRRHWQSIAGYGALITAATLGAFSWAYVGLDLGERASVSISFLTLALAQLFHVFNMRTPGQSIWRNEVTRNPWVWGATGLCLLLLAVAVFHPTVSEVLFIQAPSPTGWGIIALMSLAPLVVGQVAKSFSPHSGD